MTSSSYYGPEDQVARREAFSRQHPGVSVSYNQRDRQWDATWNGKSGARKITRNELRDLLDELEQELDGRPAPKRREGSQRWHPGE